MGNRLAPLIAIIFMHSLESKAKLNYSCFPEVYIRYIDDIFGIWNHSEDELNNFLNIMNNLHPNIKFTIEKPDSEGWLNFLRMSLKINNLQIDRKSYRKQSSKSIFLHADSHHSELMKRNVIINEFKNIDMICSNEVFFNESSELFKSLLLENGYTLELINSLLNKSRSIYNTIPHLFHENSTYHISNQNLKTFCYNHNLKINHSPGDGHCLLHSVVTHTGIPLNQLKLIIRNEFLKDSVTYSIGTENHIKGDSKKQLDLYLNHKVYNLPIVDNMPNILTNSLGQTIFIFQIINNKLHINKIFGNDDRIPIFFLKSGDHYDAIISNIKFKHKHASFKEKFKNASVIKLPYLNENHSKEIKQILLKSNLNILPIFTPGQKLVDVLCKTALENKQCKSKNCTYKDNNCITKDVIYELSCSECEDEYIGKTKRSLHTRINEHHTSIFYIRETQPC